MNETLPRVIRIGGALALLAALLAFLVRSASGQTPPPRRLSLGEAARLAAAQTAGVKSAVLRVDQARARVAQARSVLLPQAGISPNWSSHTVNSYSFGFDFPTPPGQRPVLDPDGQIIGPVKMWDVRGEASQTLYDPEAVQRIRAARDGVGAADADVAAVAEQAAANAAGAYLRVVRNEAMVTARLADSSLAAGLLDVARDQLEAGVGVALDVTRAESQSVLARSQLIVARNDRDRSRLELRRALGIALDTPLELTDSLASLPQAESTSEVAAVDAALRGRPDLHAAEARLEAARRQSAVTRAARLPKVSVFGNDGPNGKVDNLLNTYTYGIRVSAPIFEGGRREAIAQEQDAAARDVEVRQRDLREQVAADVRGALLDINSTREQVEASRSRQRLAELEVQQARDRFRAGVAGNAEVITASQSLNAARTAMIDALTAYQAARLSLARAEGVVSRLR